MKISHLQAKQRRSQNTERMQFYLLVKATLQYQTQRSYKIYLSYRVFIHEPLIVCFEEKELDIGSQGGGE